MALNPELNALDASPVKPAFYSNIAFSDDDLLAGHDLFSSDACHQLVTVHKEMAIDCPPSFVPVVKSKPFYPPLNTSALLKETPEVIVKQHSRIMRPLMSILTSTSLNASGLGKPKTEKKYRVSPRPERRKQRHSALTKHPPQEMELEELGKDQPPAVDNQHDEVSKTEDTGQASEEDSGTVCDGTNSYSIDISNLLPKSETSSENDADHCQKPDPVTMETGRWYSN